MKFKVLIASIIFISAMIAKAEGHEPVPMDFNQKIDENHHDSDGLNLDLADHYKDKEDIAEPAKMAAKDESQKVHDFVTFEVIQLDKDSVANGEKPSVKRTYNSVSEPRLALPDVELIPKGEN